MRATFRAILVAILMLTSVFALPAMAAPGGPGALPGDVDAAHAGSDASDGTPARANDEAPARTIDDKPGIASIDDSTNAVDTAAPADTVRAPASEAETDGTRERLDSPAAGEHTATRRSMASDGDRIHLRNALRQADPNGEYAVTTSVTMPDRVTELRVVLPAQAKAVDATGFTKEGDEWAWDEETSQPTLEYRMPANRTTRDGGILQAEGNYLFVDVDDWAIVQPPRVYVSQWRYTGTAVTVQRTNVVEGEGAASRGMAYLGPHETYTHEANGQEFRLIVPAAAEMSESPAAVLDSVANASATLQVGDRDPTVFMIAAPTAEVGWGVRGLQTGPADMWVRDSEELATPENVWIHEYVHTRQGYQAELSARWFTEATATYYAALLPLEQNAIGFEEFRNTLKRGEQDPQASSVLAAPDTWENNAEYTKGSLVAAEVDRQIRLATNSSRTLASTFRDLNAHEGPIRNEDFLAYVAEVSSPGVASEAERLTTTTETPSTWDRETHNDAFAQQPARIVVLIESDRALIANGDFRDRPIERNPVRLVTDETLLVDVLVSNTGGTTGEYDISMVVDNETTATATGRLDPGNQTVERFDRTFTDPEDYTVRVGGQQLQIVVSEPAPLTVSDLTVEPDEVAAGESVLVQGVARNDDVVPGEATVTVEVDGEKTVVDTVRLDVGQQTNFRAEVTLESAGEVTITVANRSRTVTVTEPQTKATAATDGAPGFGGTVAAAALLFVSLLASRTGRGKP